MKTPILISLIFLLFIDVCLAQKKDKVSISPFLGLNKEDNRVFNSGNNKAGIFYGLELNAHWTNRKSVILHFSSGSTYFFYGVSQNSNLFTPKEELYKYDYLPTTNIAVALLYHYQLLSREKWDIGIGIGATFLQCQSRSISITQIGSPDNSTYSIKEESNNTAFGMPVLRLDTHYQLTKHWGVGVMGNAFAPSIEGWGIGQLALKISYFID